MTAYRKLTIYYFTGTGNSKNVAIWLSYAAKERNIDCQLINIGQIDRLSITQPDEDALVVFISPIHGFNYPPVMMHFIMRFPKGKNKVLLMDTRAGMLIGKYITPGLTGIAFYFSSLILTLKGYSIQAMFPVDLPSNWISVHPGLNIRTIKYINNKSKERVTAFANRVLDGKKDFRSVREIIQDVLIAPLSFAYYFFGRFFFAKTYYASRDCDNCDICIKGCPVKAIIKVDNRPYWTFDCESCMKCMSNCPKKAIETSHGFIFGLLLVSYSVLLALFYKYFELLFFAIENKTLKFVIENLLVLSFLALGYRIMHYCMRFLLIERIMVYTSLTKYKFWGRRYKALKDNSASPLIQNKDQG